MVRDEFPCPYTRAVYEYQSWKQKPLSAQFNDAAVADTALYDVLITAVRT